MKKLWIKVILTLAAFSGQAQELPEVLYKAGFENVQLEEEGDSLKVYFEHREFRNPFHSLRFADLLAKERKEEIFWIPMYHNTPIGIYTSGSYEFSDLSPEDKLFFRENNSLGKGYRFSFRIHPDLSARFGFFDQPFQTKLNLVLDTRIYLARGLSLQTGVSFPVTNDLDAQDKQPRIAPSMLHYFAQPLNSHFVGLSIGTFYYDRYGFDLEYRYAPLNSRWSFGLESGYTGFYWLSAGSFYAEELDDVYAVADVEYMLPFEDLSVRISAGQFLFQDPGVRADVLKNYGGAEIGLYVAATENGTTGGFQIAFSLFPGNIFRTRKFELRTTEEFRWEYSYTNEVPVARKYRIGKPRLADLLRLYRNPL